jgi:hypothetical protein
MSEQLTPLVQKYKDPYYQLGANGEHYLMSDGIRSRHESASEVYRLIDLKRQRAPVVS